MTENLVVNGKTYKGAKAVAITNSDGEQKLYYTDAVRSINGATPDENGNVSVKLGVDAAELSSAVETALTEAKNSGEFDGPAGPQGEPGKDGKDGEPGAPGANGKDGKDGYTPVKGVDYFDGAPGAPGANGKDGKDGTNGKDGAVGPQGPKGEHGSGGKPVTEYGAKGDGSTDDTAAFQAALAANRIVFVPEGIYVLNDTLLIRENCCLELCQSTVLDFKQTNKNCINMQRSANLRGNHATIFVPYTFGANVIHASTDVEDGDPLDVPPWTAWDPQWKMTRYITDINICKPNSWGGRCNSLDGAVYGTALDIYCERDTAASYGNGLEQSFMWGVVISGLRIAGGFVYGIRLRNKGTAWNHDMRIEAVIQSCETSVSVENCHWVHLAAAIQPSVAEQLVNGVRQETKFAKHGIKLVDSRHVDLTQSFVWDWQTARNDSSECTHIAMYGNCPGVVLNEPRYYEYSYEDVRESIYTDNPSNLEKMSILQEPITRWFKTKDGNPYFFNGSVDEQLATKEDFDSCFKVDLVKKFTDALATATDASGNIYNGVGYVDNTGFYDSAWSGYTAGAYHFNTGYIPVKAGDVIYGKGLSFNKAYDGNCRVVFFTSAFSNNTNNVSCKTLSASVLVESGGDYYLAYEGDEDSFKLTVKAKDNGGYSINTDVAYIRFQMLARSVGELPMISVNNEIKYSYEGFVADGISVKGDSVIMQSPSGKSFKLVISDSGALSTVEIE